MRFVYTSIRNGAQRSDLIKLEPNESEGFDGEGHSMTPVTHNMILTDLGCLLWKVLEWFFACLLFLYAIAWKYVPVSHVKTSRVESTHVQEVGFGSRFLKNNSLKPTEPAFLLCNLCSPQSWFYTIAVLVGVLDLSRVMSFVQRQNPGVFRIKSCIYVIISIHFYIHLISSPLTFINFLWFHLMSIFANALKFFGCSSCFPFHLRLKSPNKNILLPGQNATTRGRWRRCLRFKGFSRCDVPKNVGQKCWANTNTTYQPRELTISDLGKFGKSSTHPSAFNMLGLPVPGRVGRSKPTNEKKIIRIQSPLFKKHQPFL